MGEPMASATASVPARDSFGLRLRYACSGLLFFVGYRLFGLRRGTIRQNLRRSFPDKKDDDRERIRNDFVTRQAEILAEFDYARVMGAAELRARVQLLDPAGLLAAPGKLVRWAATSAISNGCCCASLELGSGLIAIYKPMGNARVRTVFPRDPLEVRRANAVVEAIRQELGAIRDARALDLVATRCAHQSRASLDDLPATGHRVLQGAGADVATAARADRVRFDAALRAWQV
jgi:hypothetical protein